jgi:hypothetical protein
MNVNPTSSAINLITSSQHKAATAAQDIASTTIQRDEVGDPKLNPNDLLKPIISLKEAEQGTKAGVKILQTANAMIGSLLDLKA